MSKNLIASLKSPSGRFSAKVYRRPLLGDFRTAFYMDGTRVDYADAFTASEADALTETVFHLNLSDELAAAVSSARVVQPMARA